MTNFERALPLVLRLEGGYVNDPDDPGGETNFGISKRAYPKEDIRNLTRERAGQIYRRDYWLRAGCEELSWSLCLVHFDAAVNHGLGRARRFLPESLHDPERYITLREAFYRILVKRRPASKKFLKGWLRRMNHLRQAI